MEGGALVVITSVGVVLAVGDEEDQPADVEVDAALQSSVAGSCWRSCCRAGAHSVQVLGDVRDPNGPRRRMGPPQRSMALMLPLSSSTTLTEETGLAAGEMQRRPLIVVATTDGKLFG